MRRASPFSTSISPHVKPFSRKKSSLGLVTWCLIVIPEPSRSRSYEVIHQRQWQQSHLTMRGTDVAFSTVSVVLSKHFHHPCVLMCSQVHIWDLAADWLNLISFMIYIQKLDGICLTVDYACCECERVMKRALHSPPQAQQIGERLAEVNLKTTRRYQIGLWLIVKNGFQNHPPGVFFNVIAVKPASNLKTICRKRPRDITKICFTFDFNITPRGEWADPGDTGIPGQPVRKSEQAPASSPSAKNQFNIDVPRWGTYQILSW